MSKYQKLQRLSFWIAVGLIVSIHLGSLPVVILKLHSPHLRSADENVLQVILNAVESLTVVITVILGAYFRKTYSKWVFRMSVLAIFVVCINWFRYFVSAGFNNLSKHQIVLSLITILFILFPVGVVVFWQLYRRSGEIGFWPWCMKTVSRLWTD